MRVRRGFPPRGLGSWQASGRVGGQATAPRRTARSAISRSLPWVMGTGRWGTPWGQPTLRPSQSGCLGAHPGPAPASTPHPPPVKIHTGKGTQELLTEADSEVLPDPRLRSWDLPRRAKTRVHTETRRRKFVAAFRGANAGDGLKSTEGCTDRQRRASRTMERDLSLQREFSQGLQHR